MKRLAAALLLAVAGPALSASKAPPDPLSYTQLEDAKLEAQASALMHEIRCVFCQGQSIADSDAEIASDMRAMVRRRIAAGETPEQIRSWLIDRYGAWVAYDPPVEPLTWPLWGAPVVFILIGIWLARGRLKRRRR